jgi:hypothetical protein
MALAEITKQGLRTISILVLILWGCFFAERQFVKMAQRDLHVAVKNVHQIKMHRTLTPASKPVPSTSAHPKPLVG